MRFMAMAKRLVRFLADRAVAHGAGLEALQDALDGFDFLEGHGLERLELEQTAQRAQVARLVIDERRVLLEQRVVARPHRLLQLVDRLRAEQVELAVLTPLVLAARIEDVAVDRAFRKGAAMAQQHLLRDLVEPDALDPGRRPGEVLVDDRVVQADRLEDLRATIALDGRDPHLRDDLDDALDGGLDVVLAGGLVVDALEQALADHVVEGLEGEVRVDGAAPVADEQREMVHLARLARFEHQADPGARAGPDQVVMQARHGQQRRDRRVLGVHPAIREDQDVDAVLDGAVGLGVQRVHGLLESERALGRFEENRQGDRLKSALGDVPELGQLLVGQDGRLELDEVAALGRGLRAGCVPSRWSSRRTVTISSRMQSMGGLVTWAKSCLK